MAIRKNGRVPDRSLFKKGIEVLKKPGKMTVFILLSIVVVVLFVLGISNPIPENDRTFEEPVFFPGGSLAKEPFEMEYRDLKQFPGELAVMGDRYVDVPSQSMWSDRGVSLYRTFGQVILAVCDMGSASSEDIRKIVVSNVLGETYSAGKEKKRAEDKGYFGDYESTYYGSVITPKTSKGDKSKNEEGYILGYTITRDNMTLAVYAVTKDADSKILSDMRSLTADCVSTIHVMGQEPVSVESDGGQETSRADMYGVVEEIPNPLEEAGKNGRPKIIKYNDELDEVEQIDFIRFRSYPDELKDTDLYNYTCNIDSGYKELTVTAQLTWASDGFRTDKIYLKSPDGGYYTPNPTDSTVDSDNGTFIWHLHSPMGGTWYIKTNKKLVSSDIELTEEME